MIRNMSRRRKWLLAITGLLVVYAITGFFIIPVVARHITVSRLTEALGRSIAIEKVRFNPFTLALVMENCSIKQKDAADDMVSFRCLLADLEWQSLFRLAPVAGRVRLDTPVIHLSRDAQGNFNFSDLIQAGEKTARPAPEPEKADESSAAVPFSLANIEITEGNIVFQDDVKGKIHRVEHLNAGVPFISSIGRATEIFVLPRFSADINGRPFSLEGKTKPFDRTRETNLSLDLKDLDLPLYLAYVPAALPVSLQSGVMDIGLTISFNNTAKDPSALNLSGRAQLRNLKAVDVQGRPLLDLDRLGVELAPSPLLKGEVHLSAVELVSPQIHLLRDAEGKLNVFSLQPPDTGAAAEEKPAPDDSKEASTVLVRVDGFRMENAAVTLTEEGGPETTANTAEGLPAQEMVGLPRLEVDAVSVDTGKREVTIGAIRATDGRLRINRLEDGLLNLQVLSGPAAESIKEEPVGEDSTAEKPARKPSPPWVVSLGTLTLYNGQVRADHLLPENSAGVVIDNIRVAVASFSTRRDSTASVDFSCRLNESGLLTVKGEAGMTPVSAGLTVGLEHLGLPGLYPFMAAYVPAEITGGDVFLQGDVSLAQPEGSDLKADFSGQAAIRDFKTIDRKKGGPLMAFDALELKAVRAGNRPLALEIGDILLNHPAAELAVDAGGHVNLARAAEKNGPAGTGFEADPSPESADESVSIHIGKITLADGRLRFSDLSQGRPFQTELSKINLQVTGLSSRPDHVADITFSGLLDNQAGLSLSGRISPLSREIFADLILKVENMELGGLSPYSGKYIGRDIAKGKLFTDLTYSVKDRKMTGKNHVFIDQFELGGAVDSPGATRLPVGLAVALLRDRQGKIVLEVPVSGDLNDPKFSLGRIILQAFTNIVVKAATSPFSLVGAAMGGADPSHLEFAYGSADIPEKIRPALDKLVALMFDRPSLAIELSGFVDGEKDRQALADLEFMRKLKAVKHAGLSSTEARATSVDDVVIAAGEFEEYVWQAYKREEFPKQKNILGLDSRIPSAEMEALMRQHIKVDDGQLKMLADQRARQIRDRILASGKVEPERLFVVEVSYLKPESVEGGGSSRVDVRLK